MLMELLVVGIKPVAGKFVTRPLSSSFFSRTELLGCYNDHDFLAKLHCVRQAFQVGLPVAEMFFC